MRAWFQREGWSVSSPTQPTFDNGRVTSTINFAVHRAVEISSVTTPEGPWTGAIDHSPIVIACSGCYYQTAAAMPRIPKSGCLKKRMVDSGKPYVEEILPTVINRLQEVSNPEEIQKCYERLVKTLLTPWEKLRQAQKSRRFKLFWTTELDNLDKLRINLYKIWKLTRSTDDKDNFQQVHKLMKRGAKKARTASYSHFTSDMQQKSEHMRLRTLANMLRAKQSTFRRNIPWTRKICS